MAVAMDLNLTEKIISGWAMLIANRLAVILTAVATALITLLVSHGSPRVKALLLILEPSVWEGAMRSLTQPVLFLLLNLVILSIWATSTAPGDGDAAADTMEKKEEKLHAGWGPPKPKILQISSSSKSMASSPPPKTEHSCFQVSDCLTDISAPAAPIAKRAIARQPKRSYSAIANPSDTSEQSNRSTVSNPKGMTVKKTHKLEKRSASFQVSSRLTVRDVSCEENCLPEVMVMEEDELNERIEAFFARFREQLRRESGFDSH